MNRQERRKRERSSQKYEQRQTFTKKEVEEMNALSYQHGVAFALYGAKKALELGEVRLDRIRKEVLKLEGIYFDGSSIEPLPFNVQDMVKYRGAALANTAASKNGQIKTK
ncbi:hypothetical protein HWB91_gp51 [Bacillus phage vB_BboS-125]|uniref:Uncharacterized protein n=1 Tax=Bacillus phage vB_BboS-125 TaxID=2419618 RepID=A0A3G3BWH5_9CAUD|nr:hypothetical protein HWB91_gp51 [Bacillus phage vB_BboS-125]AYP68421.1 hypothetical protein BboS125_00052 [Bacillus phage vB_BboS-125]